MLMSGRHLHKALRKGLLVRLCQLEAEATGGSVLRGNLEGSATKRWRDHQPPRGGEIVPSLLLISIFK